MAWLGLGLDHELTVVRLCIELSKIVADGDVICIVVLYLWQWMSFGVWLQNALDNHKRVEVRVMNI